MQVALRAAAHTCCRVAGLPHRPCTAAAATYAAAAMATGVGVAMGTCVMECKTPSVKEQLGSILTRLDGVESALAKTNDGVVIRPGRAADAEPILEMIRDLAIFEKELDQLQMTAATLRRDGWPTAAEVSVGARPRFDTFVAEVNGDTVGFALYFHIYSTWEGLRCGLTDPASDTFDHLLLRLHDCVAKIGKISNACACPNPTGTTYCC